MYDWSQSEVSPACVLLTRSSMQTSCKLLGDEKSESFYDVYNVNKC